MNAEQFIEGVRDLLHERAKATGPVPASDLAGLLRQVEEVFDNAGMPDEESPTDLQNTVDELRTELADAEKDRDKAKAAKTRLEDEVDRLKAKLAEFGDDPNKARAAEVERLRTLSSDCANILEELAADLAKPRVRKERVVSGMRGLVEQIRAEVGPEADDGDEEEDPADEPPSNIVPFRQGGAQ